MKTNKQNKTFEDSLSLENEESNLKVNRNANGSVSALVKHKEGYRENPKKTINKVGLNGQLVQGNNHTPQGEVSIEFAAKQLFQILLIDIKYRTAKLNNLEPVPVPFAGI